MRSVENIRKYLDIAVRQTQEFEKQLAHDMVLLHQGRIIQDEVRQSELRYECALTTQEVLRWVLQQENNEPF